jgi:hypothetical protein
MNYNEAQAVKKLLSLEMRSIQDKALESVLRNIVFSMMEDTPENWQKIKQLIVDNMPEEAILLAHD